MDSNYLVSEDTPPATSSAATARNVIDGFDESLVADARAGLTPADMVERKLVSLLRSTPIPVSQTGRRRPARIPD